MRFSIITCTYNSEKFISFCLESIAKQTFPDFEVIIVDSYSTDKTIDIIKKFDQKIPIRIFRQKKSGISKAMNLGIRKATGEFLIHLHSDDLFFDNQVLYDVDKFLKVHKYLDWIYGKINIMEENGVSIATYPERKIFQLSLGFLLKYINFIPHQAVFIKREVFNKFGMFDENLTSCMDIDFWLRIYKETEWRFLDRVIASFRIHQNAQSSSRLNKEINKRNFEQVLKRHTNWFEFTLLRLLYKILWRYNKNLR